MADLVDNSITAKSSNVWLKFHWNGADSYVTVLDDGAGMTENVLREAMRPGTFSPLDPRQHGDLGRFGLGLKTASFSQCRRLTVRSRSAKSSPVTRCWDLDHVNDVRRWRLLIQAFPETEERLKALGPVAHGTIVVWEKLDRLAGRADRDDRGAHRRFLEMIDRVERHLAMVFHRFMSGPKRRLKIWINGHVVEPWDPFMLGSGTEILASELMTLHGETLRVSPYVLLIGPA